MANIVPAKSAYTLFSADQHSARRDGQQNGQSMGDRMREIAEAWRSLDDATREKYEKLAEKDRNRFAKESAERDEAFLAEQREKRALYEATVDDGGRRECLM